MYIDPLWKEYGYGENLSVLINKKLPFVNCNNNYRNNINVYTFRLKKIVPKYFSTNH